jgi:hypothetical protein
MELVLLSQIVVEAVLIKTYLEGLTTGSLYPDNLFTVRLAHRNTGTRAPHHWRICRNHPCLEKFVLLLGPDTQSQYS